jgi:RHS repeat-associated protein
MNSSRLKRVTYPDGRGVEYGYGSEDSIDDLTNRIKEVKDGETPLVEYMRRGINSTVQIKYLEPNVEMTYIKETSAPVGDAGDRYTGLDRFNRIEDIRWKDSTSAADVERYQYGFDRAGNRTWRRHVNAPDTSETNGGWDEAYAYDGLYQLIGMGRGDLNLNQTGIAAIPKWAEYFAFDAAGNWLDYQAQVAGATQIEETRTHNAANEITEINGSDATVGYDAAGNMTTMPKVGESETAQTLVWDGWNRLVRVEEESVSIGEYRYDGLNRRITKYLPPSEVMRHYYYSDQWQVLEERLGVSESADRQFIWGLRYMDDLVLRDRFAQSSSSSSSSSGTSSSSSSALTESERLYALHDQWHVVALLDPLGTVVERYAYSAFGNSFVLEPDYSNRGESLHEWETRYGAYRYDQETILYQVRYRYLDSSLGRWLSRDGLTSAEILQGPNLYPYVIDCPTGFADPMGTSICDDLLRETLVDACIRAAKASADHYLKTRQAHEFCGLVCCCKCSGTGAPIGVVTTGPKEGGPGWCQPWMEKCPDGCFAIGSYHNHPLRRPVPSGFATAEVPEGQVSDVTIGNRGVAPTPTNPGLPAGLPMAVCAEETRNKEPVYTTNIWFPKLDAITNPPIYRPR